MLDKSVFAVNCHLFFAHHGTFPPRASSNFYKTKAEEAEKNASADDRSDTCPVIGRDGGACGAGGFRILQRAYPAFRCRQRQAEQPALGSPGHRRHDRRPRRTLFLQRHGGPPRKAAGLPHGPQRSRRPGHRRRRSPGGLHPLHGPFAGGRRCGHRPGQDLRRALHRRLCPESLPGHHH